MSIVELPPPESLFAASDDPFLDLPLSGVHLIEASAGTGKTFTLATIVTRLIVERGLRVGQVLAVTYTDAATQELRERLRRRLITLARVAAGGTLPGADDAEVALCRRLVERRQQVEDPLALRARLAQAVRELDLAAVFTIHGFCARVLADHALETGERFDAESLVGDDRELRTQVAHDLWRALAAEPEEASRLERLWPSGPDGLAQDLVELLRAPALRPEAPADAVSPLPEVLERAAALRASYLQHRDDAMARVTAALEGDVLNRSRVRADTLEAVWAALDDWRPRADCTERPHKRLDLLTPATLADCVKKGRDGRTLVSPLFDDVQAWLDTLDAYDTWLDQRRIATLHRVRDEATRRLARLKRQRRVRGFDDLIDGVARALDGTQSRALLGALRNQYHAALVDEFQDTDARQWSIFRRVFGEDGDDAPLPALDDAPRPARFLALIGDPKQAIYRFRGGDVHTYLRARAVARTAPPLARNFRSRPCLLHAVQALYDAAGDSAFVDARIRFHPVAPGGRRGDDACLRDGVPAAALTVRRLPSPDDASALDAEQSRRQATRACAQAIHETLALAAAGRMTIDAGARTRAVEPGDLAVLVRTHDEAARVQHALAALGIPAVATGPTSVFATEQALELLAMFDALLAPADPLRLHAALATVLVGADATRIEALTRDDAARARELSRAIAWRERWLRAGPLALVNELCAQAAPRLLELVDGERRLSDFMQLGEALQEAAARALGPQALVDWLRARIAGADDRDPEQQLRLESDARRVQILTVHKSKGLEFPFVFLPFAAIGRPYKSPDWCDVDDGDGRILHLAPDDACKRRHREEVQAEDARLLYVALTRAEHALWVCTGAVYGAKDAPLNAMDRRRGVVRRHRRRRPTPRRQARTAARVAAGANAAGAPRTTDVVARLGDLFLQRPRAPGQRRGRDAAAACRARIPADDVWHAGPFDIGAELAAAAADDPRFAGARFGDVVHAAMETVDFAAWRDWRDGPPPPGQQDALVEAFRAEGYAQTDIDDGLPLLASLVGHTLTSALPEQVRLCDLAPASRCAEMEFHFAIGSVGVDALLSTVQAHGLLTARAGFGTRRTLDGLMTGKIDLVYAHDDRYFVLDYKTNRLPDYGVATLERAMHDGEYTLQAAIYTLALHRWLRFRMGEAYDAERHLGGVRYLFCRGLDARRDPTPGLYAARLPLALVDELDRLFRGSRRMSLLDGLQRSGAVRPIDLALAHCLQRIDGGVAEPVLIAAALASYAVAQGHTAFDLETAPDLVEAPFDWPTHAAWCEALQDCSHVARPTRDDESEPGAPLVSEDGRLYLRRYREYERRLAAALARLCDAAPTPIAPEVDSLHARLFPQRDTGDAQARAARTALDTSVMLVTGGPGTGKTTTIARVLVLLAAQARARGGAMPRIALAAPTGRAADRMAGSVRRIADALRGEAIDADLCDALPTEASTLHRLLGLAPGRPHARFNASRPLKLDVLVVDEASMVDLPLMCKLVEAMPVGARLLLLGDRDQLPSVEAGDVLTALADAADAASGPLAGRRVHLDRGYRQTDALMLEPVADAVRRGDVDAALRGLREGAGGVDYREGAIDPLAVDAREGLLAPWRALLAARDAETALRLVNRARLLTALRNGPQGADTLNERIEAALAGPAREAYFHGRLLMIVENSARHGLFNGDVGVCLRDADGTPVAWFDGADGVRGFHPGALPAHTGAFAMTVHKAQGSEFDTVWLQLPAVDTRVLTRELVYTGLTRARSALHLLGPADAIGWALSRHARRVSGLARRLGA